MKRRIEIVHALVFSLMSCIEIGPEYRHHKRPLSLLLNIPIQFKKNGFIFLIESC